MALLLKNDLAVFGAIIALVQLFLQVATGILLK